MLTMADLFEEIKSILIESPHTDSSSLLAKAMASACNSAYGVSLLECSIKLDDENRKHIWHLANIRSLQGYSNGLQDETLRWLRENEYI